MVKNEQKVAGDETGKVEVEGKIKLEYCSTLAELPSACGTARSMGVSGHASCEPSHLYAPTRLGHDAPVFAHN